MTAHLSGASRMHACRQHPAYNCAWARKITCHGTGLAWFGLRGGHKLMLLVSWCKDKTQRNNVCSVDALQLTPTTAVPPSVPTNTTPAIATPHQHCTAPTPVLPRYCPQGPILPGGVPPRQHIPHVPRPPHGRRPRRGPVRGGGRRGGEGGGGGKRAQGGNG